MAEKDSFSAGGFPFSVPGLLALLALASSVLLVSRQLASDRPHTSAGKAAETIGDQTIEARLWEDPFFIFDKNSGGENGSLVPLQFRLQTLTNAASMVLPVMIPGGAYSEDHEARLRTRFAVVAALGQAGFVPDDPDHLGSVRLAWPTSLELDALKGSSFAAWSTNFSSKLEIGYEWYHRRTFYPQVQTNTRHDAVLVLWLNEDSFADAPLTRLAYLLQPLLSITGEAAVDCSVIGPRRSATLRAMLPGEFGGPHLSEMVAPELWTDITNVLQRTRLFSATATAMDEVLVGGTNDPAPRAAVAQRLTDGLFQSFHNFSATDSQLAEQILDEVALRNVDVCATSTKNHLVLISEWDTFYGRMLSLTYAAELARKQNPANFPDRETFVAAFRRGSNQPANLHSFVYLRGLDGQATGRDSEGSGGKSDSGNSGEGREPSAGDLKRWTPDANKAIGQAQFDYLSRLGERIEQMSEEISDKNHGTIGAIGIVGSDFYDTLLILQALRPRFPNAVFFTTVLDARLWDPAEWQWSRNLVVATSYGLQLHPDLQREVAPFRDSSQTAQFAAVLAAVDDKQSQLLTLTNIPPRRFEIGRFGPVDLSVTNVGNLHPVPPGLRGTESVQWSRLALSLLGLVALTLLATLIFRPWIRLTRERRYFLADCLWMREEDIGGLEGFRVLRNQTAGSTDSISQWMVRELWSEPGRESSTELWVVNPSKPGFAMPDNEMKTLLEDRAQMQRFLDKINKCLRAAWSGKSDDTIGPFTSGKSLVQLRLNRQRLCDLLHNILSAENPAGDVQMNKLISSRAAAAASAQNAGTQKYYLRFLRQWGFWISAVVFLLLAAWLGHKAWHDDNSNPFGEPVSLISGTSAWPTEWLRFLAIALALGFIMESYTAMRATVLDLTREFRLRFSASHGTWKPWLASTPVPQAVVEADALWEEYQQKGRWSRRLLRIVLPLGCYFIFAVCLFLTLGTNMHSPLRGADMFRLDRLLLLGSVLSFLFLTFWTMDAARLCRWFIEHLSEAPSHYPKATREHFSSLRGGMPGHLLAEWLDLRIIAALTERVGRLIYFPFIVFFILLIARNSWWDCWPWSAALVIVFILNLVLAVGGLLILRRAAQRARAFSLASLQTKLDQLRAAEAVTAQEKSQATLGQVEKLLDEIQGLNTGAFAGFWESPIFGALLVPSGGTAVLELIRYLTGN